MVWVAYIVFYPTRSFVRRVKDDPLSSFCINATNLSLVTAGLVTHLHPVFLPDLVQKILGVVSALQFLCGRRQMVNTKHQRHVLDEYGQELIVCILLEVPSKMYF